MVSLSDLWIPIVLSAVVVFVGSSILHMVLPYHRSDYKPLPDEERVMAVLRGVGLKRGLYVFPFCMPKDMKSPAAVEKYKAGPVGMMTIFPSGPPAMPKFLGQWFLYCLIISFFVALVADSSARFGSGYHHVFHVAGLSAFLAYGLANLVNGVWRGQPWSVVIKEVVDGLIYALLTAGTFARLWPR
jgi:hypothetical protein